MYKTVVIIVIACIKCALNQSVATGNARGKFIFSQYFTRD